MQSTNFEFMREHRSDLADEAAAIERDLYDSPSSAIDLLRTFGQRLLQHLLDASGKPIRDPQGQTFGFDELLQKHFQCIPEAQRKQFTVLRLEGNKQHEPQHAPTSQDVEQLLKVAWQLAHWVGEQLGWQGIPIDFVTPPEGGHAHLEMQRRVDDERRQKVAALQREAEAKRWDVSGWICDDQGNVAPPADFVGRDFVFDEMKSFLASSERRVLVIQGQPGRGKTAIIQRFLSEECPVGISPFIFYFRDQESRADPVRWIRHLYASVVKRCGLPPPNPSILQAKPEDLVQRLRNGIEEAAQKHPDMRLLFLIDGVDEAGPADELVWSFLTSMFSSTVKVIATTRRMHRSVSPKSANEQLPISWFDLDKYRTKHDVDGRKWVEKTMPSLPKSTIDRVVQLSDANFLVLRGICRELREVKEPELANRLRELSELKATGKDLGRELYERTWKRLERLPVENLDRVEKLAALLANASVPLSERTLKDILKLRRADWVNLQQCFAEYLVHSLRYPSHGEDTLGITVSKGDASTSEPIPVVRLFHQTFAEFVRELLRDDMVEANARLAEYCLEQIRKRRAGYEVRICGAVSACASLPFREMV